MQSSAQIPSRALFNNSLIFWYLFLWVSIVGASPGQLPMQMSGAGEGFDRVQDWFSLGGASGVEIGFMSDGKWVD